MIKTPVSTQYLVVKQSNNNSHPSLLKHGAREYIAKYQKEMTGSWRSKTVSLYAS